MMLQAMGSDEVLMTARFQHTWLRTAKRCCGTVAAQYRCPPWWDL